MQNKSNNYLIEQYNRNRPSSQHISSVDQISNAYSQSWLTIRQEDGTDDWGTPIMWLDDGSEYDLFVSNDLNIDWVEEMDKEGSPIIEDDHLCRDICIEVTCPSKGWNKRRAVGYNIDFDWN